MIERNHRKLRKLLKAQTFTRICPRFTMRLAPGSVEHAGFETVYNGGYVADSSRTSQ